MKASEIKTFSNEDIFKKLKELKSELFNLRFQLAINQLENPMRIKAVKKDIARAQTILRERELQKLNERADVIEAAIDVH